MNIAIVVDDLIQRGGQERLLTAVSEIWPNAPIYTTVASDYWVDFYMKKNVNVRTSFMQYLPLVQNLNRYYSPFLFHALAFDKFNFSSFDVVVSVSSRYAHFINTKPQTTHISYMNTPGRMFWEAADYFLNENYGFFKPIRFLAKPFLSFPLNYLRSLDFVSAQKVDHIIANSKNSAGKVARYYKRYSDVIYPYVDNEYFNFPTTTDTSEKYFVLISRLISWKKVDIAITACKELDLKLKIIGEGPDKKRLQTLANENVEFLGYVSDRDKMKLISNSQALIQTQSEDFGIVPLEAQALGIPVIAYGKGGVLETVINGTTGIFFEEQTSQSLVKVLKEFEPNDFNKDGCINQAKNFSKSGFKSRLENYVNQKWDIMETI